MRIGAAGREPVFPRPGRPLDRQTLTFTRPQFLKRLRGVSDCRLIGLTAVTVPKMRKRDNPFFGRVLKITDAAGPIGWQYKRVVNRQRTRENAPADFQPQPRAWGQRLAGTPLVEHNGRFYLEVKVQNATSRFIDAETGEPIDRRELAPFLPARKSESGPTKKPIRLRDFAIADAASTTGIAELRTNGQVWRVGAVFRRLQRTLSTAGAI